MLRAALLLLAALAAAPAGAEITGARYAAPTSRYAHGVLGDAVEYGALELTLANGRTRRIILPESRVFEDLAPRLADVDGDGAPEVIAVDTDLDRGARLSIYDETGLVAATPYIGTRFRWLAPLGAADLDGEYIDSSEGYVTELLDYRRDHFAASETPLCFDPYTFQPGIFRGLISFEYIRAIADDLHGMDRLMMANSTPNQLCWNAPLLDVLGAETNWNPGGRWQPMSDADLLYRRVLCKGKPYCFLMNTEFEQFPHERVELYMKRSLAYGMFPGFFSHNAAEGHYFTRPELYNRDRKLFKKYVPLCRQVAEAGWEPITGARTDNEDVYVERFGAQYLTVLNDSREQRTVTIELDRPLSLACDELVGGTTIDFKNGKAVLTLGPEDVALLLIPGLIGQ